MTAPLRMVQASATARGPRYYKGPDSSRSDPLVEYGIGLPFGGLRSWTRPRNEFCSPRGGARIPQRLLENEHLKLANVTNRGRDNRCRDGYARTPAVIEQMDAGAEDVDIR